MKKIKGSVTVFITMLSMVLLSFSLLMVDCVRIAESSNYMTDAMAVSVMAADNLYNKDIFKDLGIVVYTMSDNELEKVIEDILAENTSEEYQVGLHMIGNMLLYNKMLTDGWVYSIADVISRYISFMDMSMNSEDRLYCNNPNSYDDDIDTLIYGVLADPKMVGAIEKHNDGKNYYQLAYDFLEEGKELKEAVFAGRFSKDIMEWCGGTERIAEDFRKADTEYSMSEGMMYSYLNGVQAENRKIGFKWYNASDMTVYGDDGFMLGKFDAAVLFGDYHFNTILNNQVGKSGLKAELEYLLYGNRTDRENVAKVLSEIMKIRMYMNLKSLLKAGEIKSLETVCWAMNESWFDALMLYKGGNIEWEKSICGFFTTSDMSISEVENKAENTKVTKLGRSYKDYLLAQFYLSCYSGQICCCETLYANILDLIGYSYGVDVKQTKIGTIVFWDYSFSEKGYDKALTTLGKSVMENKVFSRTYYLGGV